MVSEEQALALYERAGAAHDFDHVRRVLALAERIGALEGANMRIVRTAALLHDMAHAEAAASGACHAALGALRARDVLAGFPADDVDAVAHAIAAHRFRNDVQPATLEAWVVSDADKLDAIGAIGVARAYAVAGRLESRLWGNVEPGYQAQHAASPQEHTPVHEYVYKLARLKDQMYTATARRIAAGRHDFMVQFFEQLDREVNGDA
jgi:uncharacterized protein